MRIDVCRYYLDFIKHLKCADKIFYKHNALNLKYKDLYERVCEFNAVFKQLERKVIAIYSDKCFDVYAGIYATILSNNIWLPVSKELPIERNILILKSSKASLFIYDTTIPESIKKYLDENNIEYKSFQQLTNINPSYDFQIERFKNNDVAYIMYTSGSTGVPKGVPMTHENYINFINNAINILPFKSNEVFADFHDFTFDISIFYLFVAIIVNGSISPIIDRKDKIIPLNHIIQNGVTVWATVPSVINRIMSLHQKTTKTKNSLSILFLCGENFKLDVLEYGLKNLEIKNIYNFYGLTESGVENFYHHCTPSDLVKYSRYGMVPIGKPLPANEVKITEENELLISGCQITKGYINGVMRQKFIKKNNKIWFKTGDIVEYNNDVFICKGRLDTQVKISGHRVELSDVEANLTRYIKGIKQAVCILNKNNIFAALIVDEKISISLIQEELKQYIPKYMIPKRMQILKELPINNNGKIDRKSIAHLWDS